MSNEITLNIDIKVEEVMVNGTPVVFNAYSDSWNDISIDCELTVEIAREFLEEEGYTVTQK